MLAVAIGCGLVAMLGVQQSLSGDTDKNLEVNTTKVLVVSAEITPGTPLDDTNVELKDWPKDMVPPGAVTTTEEYEGRALIVQAVPGEVVFLMKLGEPGVVGASHEIPPGMRVVTVSVDATMTHSGLILPGDHVDISVTYSLRTDSGPVTKTKTVLEDIQIFATDKLRASLNTDQAEVDAKNISFLVSPEQANLLKLAETKGDLSLTLRSNGDHEIANPETISDLDFESNSGTSAGKSTLASTSEKSGNLQDFLDETEANPKTEVAQGKSEENTKEEIPEIPKWKIEIFAGDQRRVEEVDLPEEITLLESNDSFKQVKSYFNTFFTK